MHGGISQKQRIVKKLKLGLSKSIQIWSENTVLCIFNFGIRVQAKLFREGSVRNTWLRPEITSPCCGRGYVPIESCVISGRSQVIWTRSKNAVSPLLFQLESSLRGHQVAHQLICIIIAYLNEHISTTESVIST